MKERQKMQRYRQRLAAKVVYLKDLTKKMESQIRVYTLQRRSSRTLLAWEHIANALREESDATTTTNAALRDQCTQHATLIRSMKQWVMQVAGTSAESVPVSPTCMSRRPLQNLTLSADPYARRLGFDWITRHLYHNCDSAFQRMGFPASANETLASFSVDMTDPDCCMYTWRSQREFPASVEYVRDVFARPNLVGQMHGTFRRQSTLLQLPQDSLYDTDGGRIALDRVAPDRTCVRAMCINSHGFIQGGGYSSFEEEALRWGCDVSALPTDHQRHQHFERHVLNVGGRNGNSFVEDFDCRVNSMRYGDSRVSTHGLGLCNHPHPKTE
ncbi:hypothetical protein DYB38_012614 [Aphanomyces astaci]|uniref:Uncharacterized protein n=1 Tax=Aphanomyces astaci TaxID=112090 RepID=A0A397D5H1_APHAT|nr:hypothetical protein DYB38_012614 [Aphanomyces astaci]